MDALFKRYASPFTLIDNYIRVSRFSDFVQSFIKQKNEDDMWEYFLHKIWDKTYAEYCEDVRVSQAVRDMTEDETEAIVKESMRILGNYRPEKGGES